MDYKYDAVQRHLVTKRRFNKNAISPTRTMGVFTLAFILVCCIAFYLTTVCLKYAINTQINFNLATELAQNKQYNDELNIILKSLIDKANIYKILNTEYIKVNQLYISLINKITKKERLSNEQWNRIHLKISRINKDIEDNVNYNNVIKDQLEQLKNEINNLTNSVSILKHDISVLNETKAFDMNNNDKYNSNGNDLRTFSKILTSNSELIMLHQWIGLKYNLNYKLLYRGSACGFSVKVFHLKCDFSTNPLLILVHTVNNLTIGGFVTKSLQGKTMNEDKGAFLFSINNNRKYSINDPLNAFYSSHTFFMYFGQGDLVIYANEIESYFPISYGELFAELPLALTNGSNIIKYDEIEAFSVEMTDIK